MNEKNAKRLLSFNKNSLKSKTLQHMGQVSDMFQDYKDMYLKNLDEIHTPQGLFEAARAFLFFYFLTAMNYK